MGESIFRMWEPFDQVFEDQGYWLNLITAFQNNKNLVEEPRNKDGPYIKITIRWLKL